MQTTSQERYRNGERIMILSQLLASITGTEILIGGDFNLHIDQVQSLISWLNNLVPERLESLLPEYRELGYMDCMARNVMSPERRLRQLRLHKCETRNGSSSSHYFLVSKEMQLMEKKTITLDRLEAKSAVLKVDKRPETYCQQPTYCPQPTYSYCPPRQESRCPRAAVTDMYIPPRPPKHHGG